MKFISKQCLNIDIEEKDNQKKITKIKENNFQIQKSNIYNIADFNKSSIYQLLFNIEDIQSTIINKINNKDFIFLKKKIPYNNIEIELDILKGYSSPYINNINYFISYATLHELLQIINKNNLQTINYYIQNILIKTEEPINILKDKIAKQESINKDDIITFDFSFNDKFFIKMNHYKKGSDIKNYTYCYNTNMIFFNNLDIFKVENIKKNNCLLIKFSSLMSIATIEILKVLSTIFKEISIFKIINDSFFKDSFHILCVDCDVKNYNKIKKEILKQSKNNYSETPLKSILKKNKFNFFQALEYNLKEFSICNQLLIQTHINELINAFEHGLSIANRDKDKWKYLDKYYNNYI